MMPVMTTTVDAKSAARQRVRAYLDARAAYDADLGEASDDEITRHISVARIPYGMTSRQWEASPLSQGAPLLASDLALLAADD